MSPRKGVIAEVLVYSLALLPILAGCGESPPLDMSLLTGEPCEPPCWQGLTPGESTLQEVNEFMRTSRFVDPQTVDRSQLDRGGQPVGLIIWWLSTVGGGRGYNSFSIEDGVLNYMTIYPDYPLTLERLIERYGPPEKYVAGLRGWGFVPLDVAVTLFYPTHGFTVDLVLRADDATLQPQSKVVSVWYFRAAPLERFLELRIEAGYVSGTLESSLESLHDWQGYGALDLD
ncbi:MAG: hypothetical protein GTO63_09870 [Anaerolineae bacterium]|nr:hypothetical protein [Anaerolineae bacterium]NIN95221.1 hypothetical protein [Anaerolineae bacterium]NIQ78191.1 hypothetical protein [Anaerolineae bacterium]